MIASQRLSLGDRGPTVVASLGLEFIFARMEVCGPVSRLYMVLWSYSPYSLPKNFVA